MFVEKQRCLTREDIAIFRKKCCLAKSKIRQITLQRSKKNFYLYRHKGNPAELNTKWNIENNNPNDFFYSKVNILHWWNENDPNYWNAFGKRNFTKNNMLMEQNGNKSPRLEQIFKITHTITIINNSKPRFLNIFLSQAESCKIV